MDIAVDMFGSFKDPASGKYVPVSRYTLQSKTGTRVQVLSYGAGISDIQMPDKDGNVDHVVLGFNSMEDYLKFNYIGSSIGRHANRICKGKFNIDGETYSVSINNNDNHNHGGKRGWDKYVWESYTTKNKVVFSHTSPEGDEGYPGTVMAQVSYSLLDDGSLCIDYQAMTTKPTPINITNHSFFNLAGHNSGKKGLYEHMMKLNAASYLPVTPDLIPTGEILSVKGNNFDLTSEKCMKEVLPMIPGEGFDHCFVLSDKQRGKLELVGTIKHPPSGRVLEVHTTEPGLQIYTGNFLPKSTGVMVGREGISYTYQGAFCVEPQNFPNAINQTNFPNSILKPGQVYEHRMVYKFYIEN